jgi:sensor histidine kinase regulating citrate/malate metabolism
MVLLEWPGPRGWSLARQLIMLQLCVVVTAVTIEAMVAIYRVPHAPGATVASIAAKLEQRQILGLVTLTEVALLVGIAGSLFLADRVRKQTFDMEPAEIARQYQHHDAMLHAVREGLIITSADGSIVLANDEARRLLGLSENCDDQVLRDQLADAGWTAMDTPATDQMQYANGRVLMVSSSQAEIDGELAGMVITLRDLTELRQATSQLDEERRLSNELRKQAHEHANHLQMIIALISMEEYDEAMSVCARYSEMPQALSNQVLTDIADPVLASRLQILHARAERWGVELILDGMLEMAEPDLADVVGNLADNAIDAAAEGEPRGWVQISFARGADTSLLITVRDSGRGILADHMSQVFTPSFSTKGHGRGFGLALAHDKVARLNGTITAHNDGGAVFEVHIPAVNEAGEEVEQ